MSLEVKRNTSYGGSWYISVTVMMGYRLDDQKVGV
jgi:hypothetical protein